MNRSFSYLLILISCLSVGCRKSGSAQPAGGTGGPGIVAKRPASLGILGDTSDVTTKVSAGTVLMGGGKDVEAAFKWMIERSGGGDVVIIRASGTDAYNPFVNALGKVNSVETLKIDSRALANNDTVANRIRNAEMLFIAGGDQSDYMNYWRDTKTEDAINYLLNIKKVPVGGTSAGCAILSGYYYSGENGSVVSAEALADPSDPKITVYNNDFLKAPYLSRVITDQHYLTRGREGRHVVFLARILTESKQPVFGIAADERTAVCIDENGIAKVLGSSKAYFIISDPSRMPEQFTAGKPLVWKQQEQALKVYEITGSEAGNGRFDLNKFNSHEPSGGSWYWWWAENANLNKKSQ